MLMTLATLAGLALTLQSDTTVSVQPGTRLSVNNFGGEIVVRAGAERRVRVEASHSSGSRVEIESTEGVLAVKTRGRRGPAHSVDLRLTVPRAMSLSLSGVHTDVDVEGIDGDVSVETVEGDVRVSRAGGGVTVRSVEGDVTLDAVRGRVDAGSVDGDVRIHGADGELRAETVDGDIFLFDVKSSTVEASTVDGDVRYRGAIRDQGRYRFATHDGDVMVGIPDGTNATITVSSFDGDFDASFPVQLADKRKHRFQITLGTGSAQLELETFDGDVRLRRPAEIPDPPRRGRGSGDEDAGDAGHDPS
jgi:DUF4097 and DUF4098 domain-containing protein YvlB